MLLDRHRERFRFAEAFFWSASWGLGAALGVALGGWLTLVGGSGAPGAEGLDPLVDIGLLPLGAFVAVVFVHLIGQLIAGGLRGRAEASGEHKGDEQGAEDDSVGELWRGISSE
ncbi:MAG: hypothetical protein WBJ62_06910 [Coriobacteriia bacterium]